ncbi:basic secretory protein-like protein [Mucilaginibacter sp. CAU 1740]|uniref:basic secretory protein-like protein n=1 Tax=Mucilaginibacter sp. CAU 1740 TaxID=3140365 RepID=UPI00325B12F2
MKRVNNSIKVFMLMATAIALTTACYKDKLADSQDEQQVKPVFHDYLSQDSITKGPYTLIFTNYSPDFATDAGNKIKQGMIDAFFKVYPEEASIYNPKTAVKVHFNIDPSYTHVAETGNAIVLVNPKWMLTNPEDLDVVTHEVMHIVQGYKGNNPGWLTEGIADYARYTLGVNNAAAGWQLPNYSADQSYTGSYGTTARFLVWLDKHVKAGIVKNLDAACRDNTYSDQAWKTLTGKTVDELWEAYSNNPAL